MVIVGESGSGKTTTLKTINRLLEPDAGEVLIDGAPTRAHPAHLLRRRIAYFLQRIGLFPHLTVAENIGITARLLGWSRAQVVARVTERLDLINLPQSFAVWPFLPIRAARGGTILCCGERLRLCSMRYLLHDAPSKLRR